MRVTWVLLFALGAACESGSSLPQFLGDAAASEGDAARDPGASASDGGSSDGAALGEEDARSSDVGDAEAEDVQPEDAASDGTPLGDTTLEDSASGDADVATDAPSVDAGLDTSAEGCEELASLYEPVSSPGAPPFGGTLFLTPDILTSADPTSFVSLTFAGQAERVMFDRRTASFETFTPYLFEALYGADTRVEVQVNPEFSRDEAEEQALRYAEPLGRVPAFYFRDLETLWIHAGDELAGGGNNNILIHTGGGEDYIRDGILEELYLHEGAHTSLDAYHAQDPLWLAAQAADEGFLSSYARDNPTREDVAESIGPYLAIRYLRDRIDPELVATIEAVMPNRIRYWDCQGLTMDLVR